MFLIPNCHTFKNDFFFILISNDIIKIHTIRSVFRLLNFTGKNKFLEKSSFALPTYNCNLVLKLYRVNFKKSFIFFFNQHAQNDFEFYLVKYMCFVNKFS